MPMTYEQTIEYLYKQLPMFSRIGAAAYKKDLHNSIALCEAIGNPQNKFRSIHIAGTNGKGSTSHMLAAILQQAGYKTGLYTSPHIKAFGERIRINGEMINRDFVIRFTERTKAICDEIQPSFFELTVAMAFEYFAEQQVDIAVIETGLGGRLDSTNIISPLLSVITNIGYDHMDILGNTLPQIASEKAGIIKQATPVVIGEYLPETKPVFEKKAAEMQADIYFAEELYGISGIEHNADSLKCTVTDLHNHHQEDFLLDLNGSYQVKNLRTVLTAEKALINAGFVIENHAEKYALAHVKPLTGLSGRWDIIQQNPTVILDVAHNEDGIKQLLLQLQQCYPDAVYHFVLGFVKDKDVSHVLDLLPANARYYFTNAHIQRALPHESLQKIAAEKKLYGKSYDDVNEAIREATAAANTTDVVLVCGSFFIIAEIT